MGPGALRRLPAARRRRDHLARVGRAVRRARAEAHLRRARHAPPARRDPEGQAARGPARRRLGRRHRRAVLHRVPAVVRRAAGLPGPPARRVGRARCRRTTGFRAEASRVALDADGLPVGLRHDHRGLDRPGRGGARVARPGPRGAPRRAVAAGAASRRAATRPGWPSTSTTRPTSSTSGWASRTTASGPATPSSPRQPKADAKGA